MTSLMWTLRVRELGWRRPGDPARFFPSSAMLCELESPESQLLEQPDHTAPNHVKFGNSTAKNVLAVADEHGYIVLWNTSYSKNKGEGAATPVGRWQAHDNTLFDMVWSPDDTKMVTASGDQTSKYWDIEKELCLFTLHGHRGSVKTLSLHENGNMLASGSRDGNVSLYDLRAKIQRDPSVADLDDESGSINPVMTLKKIHKGPDFVQPRKRNRLMNNPQSVTCVTFLTGHGNTLATSGAGEGVIRMWDFRKKSRTPVATLSHVAGGQPSRGVSCLAVSLRGDRIIANSTDNRIYLYEVTTLRNVEKASQTFGGHATDSFYVKCKFSPDDKYILSGSSDFRAAIWAVSSGDGPCANDGGPSDVPIPPITTLIGHNGEVSGVDWCRASFGKIVTCADDCDVRIWTVNREKRLEAYRNTTPCRVRTESADLNCPSPPVGGGPAPSRTGRTLPEGEQEPGEQGQDSPHVAEGQSRSRTHFELNLIATQPISSSSSSTSLVSPTCSVLCGVPKQRQLFPNSPAVCAVAVTVPGGVEANSSGSLTLTFGEQGAPAVSNTNYGHTSTSSSGTTSSRKPSKRLRARTLEELWQS
eukprot:gb/GEZN01004296.1/.p1 GENE.gb/GEZN01004296.1/~~gb/GEZN01004296.1/.p1  ORF type:complete len:587 (+),score=46.61 gb/GEZN01004296.1/:37-1797(+)